MLLVKNLISTIKQNKRNTSKTNENNNNKEISIITMINKTIIIRLLILINRNIINNANKY